MGVLGPVVEPPSHLAVITAPKVLERSPVGPQAIGDDSVRPTVPPHRLLQRTQRSLAIAGLRDEAFEHLALVVDGAPEVVRHAVDFHVDLVEVPAPVSAGPHPVHPPAPDLCREHQPKSVPPEPHGLMGDLVAPLVQKVLGVGQ